MNTVTLYIKIASNSVVSNKIIMLEDVAKLYSADKNMVCSLKKEIIFKVEEQKENKYAFSILKIVELILECYPEVKIVNLGTTDFVICYQPPKGTNKLLEYTKTIFVIGTVFFGSAFTIMTFNEDVNIKEVFDLIYKLITGTKKSGAGVLEIAYSIGIPIGTIVFFNHFTKFKIDNDPTPLQIQMRSYEEDATKTVIANASREGKTKDCN